MKKNKGFFLGFHSAIQGLKQLATDSKLRIYAVIPLIISVFVLFGSLFFGLGVVPGLIAGFLPDPTGFLLSVLYYLVYFLVAVLGGALMLLLSMLVANIIAIPFNAILAEKAYEKFKGEKIPNKEWKDFLKFTFRMLLVGLAKASLVLMITAITFVFSFFQFLAPIGAFIGFMILASDCTDMALELENYGLKRRLRFYKKNFWELAGFASVIGCSFLLPGLSFLLLPGFFVGGSYLVNQILEGKQNDSRNSSPKNN